MRQIIYLSLALAIGITTSAQTIYYPPTTGNTWQTTDPAALGWCTDSIPPLLEFLETNNSKAFIVLKDGRIVIEQYFGTFTSDSLWYWASAGKSLTAFLVGKAQEEGFLNIEEPSSTYLGEGWTGCTPGQEAAITIRNQLTMTSGLDDGAGNVDCTDPACLTYLADPGTRWAYHNAPYTRLDGVIEGATGQTLNSYVFQKLTTTTGISGLYLPSGFNNVFFSKARSMARFGLLALNGGVWNGTPVLNDPAYFTAMVTPSQTLNASYGYLWWLNGQASFIAPGSQIVFPGELAPNAPADMFSALGKNGQQLNVVPSQGLVVVRMGDVPQGEGAAVAILFNNNLWGYLNDVICTPTAIQKPTERTVLQAYPVPAEDRLTVQLDEALGAGTIALLDALGRTLMTHRTTGPIESLEVSHLPKGSYVIQFLGQKGNSTLRFVKA